MIILEQDRGAIRRQNREINKQLREASLISPLEHGMILEQEFTCI